MVITAPTALYASALPRSPDDPTAITWLISSTDPPRSVSDTPLLTKQEESKQIPPMVFDSVQRQINVGEFIFNVNYSVASQVGSGTKSFEVGQILEFETPNDVISIENLRVPEVIDLQQNTNILDLSTAGLTDSEITEFQNQSRSMFNKIVSDINDNKAKVNQLEISIGDNQKAINETKKIRLAAELINNTILINRLLVREGTLADQKLLLLDELNSTHVIMNALYDQLLLIKEIVR